MASPSERPRLEVEEIASRDVPAWDADDMAASRRFGDAWYDQRRTAVRFR